jgi:ubiquinone/menaquinone biosynthesis C-methylase UbiE
MNYGYKPGADAPLLALQPADEPDRYCIQLYDCVASCAGIAGKRILEVGSGRGGGASYVTRYLSPSSVTGVDYSADAIAFCRQRHGLPGLTFKEGSAEALPFDDATYDVVLNVESSHCYGSIERFFAEVRRVLKPGGRFSYADLREERRLAEWRQQLQLSGLRVLSETNITANVIAALDADTERKAALIRKVAPTFLIASFENFAGLRGSAIYNGFKSGKLVYMLFVMEKEM